MHPALCPGVTEEQGGSGSQAREWTALSSKCSGSYHPDILYLVTTPPCGYYFWVCWQVSRATRPGLALEDKTDHSRLVSSVSRVNQLGGVTISIAHHTLSVVFLFYPLSTLCPSPTPPSEATVPPIWMPPNHSSHIANTWVILGVKPSPAH